MFTVVYLLLPRISLLSVLGAMFALCVSAPDLLVASMMVFGVISGAVSLIGCRFGPFRRLVYNDIIFACVGIADDMTSAKTRAERNAARVRFEKLFADLIIRHAQYGGAANICNLLDKLERYPRTAILFEKPKPD